MVLHLIRKEQAKQTRTGCWEPKRYLINQKWWTQWCDYVNFDSKIQLDNSCDINLLPKRRKKQRGENEEVWLNDDVDGGDESATDLVIDGHNSEAEDGDDHFQNEDPELYEKPPRIVNLDLLDQFVPKG